MMASPQLENGHTRIANEILDMLMKLVIPPNQRQVLDCIMRKTWGYQKKVDRIANSQIAEATGLARPTVSRCLKALTAQNLITRQGKNLGVQKDWERWIIDSAVNSPEVDSPVNSEAKVDCTVNSQKLTDPSTGVNSAVNKLLTDPSTLYSTKEKKETIQKKIYGEFKNILLTDEELQKLKEKFPAQFNGLIEELSTYLASRGKKYKSHYATILNWKRRSDGTNKHSRELPKSYTPPPSYHD